MPSPHPTACAAEPGLAVSLLDLGAYLPPQLPLELKVLVTQFRGHKTGTGEAGLWGHMVTTVLVPRPPLSVPQWRLCPWPAPHHPSAWLNTNTWGWA